VDIGALGSNASTERLGVFKGGVLKIVEVAKDGKGDVTEDKELRAFFKSRSDSLEHASRQKALVAMMKQEVAMGLAAKSPVSAVLSSSSPLRVIYNSNRRE
jgi:hypothetical protein